MMPRKTNIIKEKSEAFADRIGNMCTFLQSRRRGNYDMIRQIQRSGTSIGANISEGLFAQSGPDFISKFSIALKEANETKFWLGRLHAGSLLSDKEYDSIKSDNEEIIKLLTSITGTIKRKSSE